MNASSPDDDSEPELLSAAHPSVTREQFIPLAKTALLARLQRQLSSTQRAALTPLVRVLDAVLHHAYHERLTQLCEAYAPFDPDTDLHANARLTAEEEDAQLTDLFTRFRELLTSANFVRLRQTDIDEAMRAATDWGVSLHVDPSHFERLEVFARGDCVSRRARRRSWNNLWRIETVELPIYRRLAVIFRLRKEETHAHAGMRSTTTGLPVLIKLFKNVPKMDVDMLLPGTQVKMTWLDRGKIMLPTVSGLAVTAIKVAKGAVVFAFAGIYGLIAFLLFVAGTVGYGVKSFFGYLQTKDKYHLHLTRNLYYQNLDNNAGVLSRLLMEAEEQDFREAILAYVLLWKQAAETGWTERELDLAAEVWLREQLKTPVDFEVHDALAKLLSWKIVESDAAGRYHAVAPEEASRRLDAVWDGWFTPPNTGGESGNGRQNRQQPRRVVRKI
ncbi:MAG TPA: TMEM143 family protein [Pirellulaceae bacterium]|nr:TMEM143 family protein [Pirellulaceae bacterium]